MNFPAPFLAERISKTDPPIKVICLCAGYQSKKWRGKQLADHLFAWIPHVALTEDEKVSFNLANWDDRISHAAAKVYKTQKTTSRGELGEILLHIACILNFKAEPLICKLILKTSSNDTVKGFDGIHLLRDGAGDFRILLGESKFWENPKRGIKDAIKSLKEHVVEEFLDTEKAMLLSHIPKHLKEDEDLTKLFSRQVSSDELMAKAIFPVLVGYESKSVNKHEIVSDEFKNEIELEIEALRDYFISELGIASMPEIVLVFVPMGSKYSVISRFDQKLNAYQ